MSASRGSAAGGDRGTLLAVDGHSLAFRAFFALPVENFSTASGQPTNAVWGFATMLAQVIQAERPDHLAVAFDVKGGTFRNTLLPQYKGTRDAAPEDLLTQLPIIQRMLTALGVTFIEKPGYEGDDVIGTLASMGETAGCRTLVLSGDRDAFQLIDDDVTVLYPGHHFKDLKHMTPDAVEEKYHVGPDRYPDLAALRGETADNIPGVPGVGDGYAAKWLGQYGSLSGIIEHADEIGGKKGEALRASIDQVRLNRRVNALVRDLDLGVTVDDLGFGTPDVRALDALFTELEFGATTRRRVLDAFGAASQATVAEHAVAVEIPRPEPVTVTGAEGLRAWIGKVVEEDDASSPEGADTHEDAGGAGGEPARTTAAPAGVVDGDATCNGRMARSLVVHIEGSARPGQARADILVLELGASAAAVVGRPDDDLREALQGLLDARHGEVVVHGYKEHLHLLGSWGLSMGRPLFDTKLAAYLVQPDFHADSLEQAAARFLDLHPEEPGDESDGKGRAADADQGMLDLDAGPACDEAAAKAELAQAVLHAGIVSALAARLAPVVDERRQYGLLESIELPASHVLHGMETVGAAVDQSRLDALHGQFAADAEQAQSIAWQAAGTEVNLQSPKQLQAVLFDDMGLRPTRRTKTGSYTTSAQALQDLYLRSAGNERANTFLGALLRYRETIKLSQIVRTLMDAVNPGDGRIHTTFEQTVAATGRLSSVDPNLQNIPNRNAAGREIRSAFVPGEGFEALLSCDYSQVELRIMADLSGDDALIEAFRSGADFHRFVASLVYRVPVEEITPDQRSHVKAMSYGLAYGLSTYGLARQLGVSPAAADVLRDKYFATFGEVHDYLESLVAGAREKGYTETMFGRRRYFPALRSTNRTARDAAERGALNAPIQGSAADIMKLAMIRAATALESSGLRSRIILQIHDELVLEVAPGETGKATALVKDAMEHAVTLAVPLDVAVGVGADWQQAAH
ncbi:DNA polymerase I [uncultured Bifidobacterium sp.]|uniref:DNA polymerase I n=1 Tax=uncultured Bifidobacterium sp. TaxID=165187 RepID=UPI0028DD0C88|nr:DNA polymerase I [uncultured Bifidobacterium sp.]